MALCTLPKHAEHDIPSSCRPMPHQRTQGNPAGEPHGAQWRVQQEPQHVAARRESHTKHQSPCKHGGSEDDDDASDMDSFAPVHSFSTALEPPSLHFYTSPFQRRYQPPHPLSPPHPPLSVGSAGSTGPSTPTSRLHMPVPAGGQWPAAQLAQSTPGTLKKQPQSDGNVLGVVNGGLSMEFSNSGDSSQTDADLIAALRDTWDDGRETKGNPRDAAAAALQWQGPSLNLASQDRLHHWDSDSDSSVPSPSQCDAQSVLSESPPPSHAWLQEMHMPLTQSPLESRQRPQIPDRHVWQAPPNEGRAGFPADEASHALLCKTQQAHGDVSMDLWHHAASAEPCQKLSEKPEQQLPLQGSQLRMSLNSVPSLWRVRHQEGHAHRESHNAAVLSCPSNIPTPCQPLVGPRYTHSSSASAHDSLTPPHTGRHNSDGPPSDRGPRRGRIGSSVYGVHMSHALRDASSTDAENPAWPYDPAHPISSPNDGSLTGPSEWTSPSAEASPVLEAPSWPGRNAHRLRVKALEGGPAGPQIGYGDECGGHIPPTRRSIRHPIALLAPKAARVQRGHTHQAVRESVDSCASVLTPCDHADLLRPAGRSEHAQKWYSEPPTQQLAVGDSRRLAAAGCPTCNQVRGLEAGLLQAYFASG